jgi:tetratricopeptide (TPR) repeat protein
MFELCFGKQNIRIGSARWLFPHRCAGRFEWLALLAIRRVRRPSDAWVTLDDVAKLPSWSGKTRRHIGGNIARYLDTLERRDFRAVEADARWAGPYRLRLAPAEITFDIPISEAEDRLRLRRTQAPIPREELHRFTYSYARAQWLLFQGKLLPSEGPDGKPESAHDTVAQMAEDKSFCPRLRLLACIAAVHVLFQLGRFGAARETLEDKASLLKQVNDNVLKANYYLELAWSHQRGASGTEPNRATEEAISRARAFAEKSGDRASFGRIAYRMSGFLTKKGRHLESIDQLLFAIEAALVTGNFYELQAYCNDLGSVIHRLGPKFYKEAQQWIILGIDIAQQMGIGHDNPHGEVILGKTYAELGDAKPARHWLRAAEKIARQSKNLLALADTMMVWAFWHQRFGTTKDQIDTLVEALRIFRSLRDFDCRQKERYMERKFPSVWPEVMKAVDQLT